MNTGVSGATVLSSSSVGRRRSANCCSVKPPTTRTHCGGGVTATWRFSMAIASARLRTPSQRSSMLKFNPPRMMWVWLSHSPGSASRPFRSMTLVSGAASGTTSATLPTRRDRPSLTATALATGWARSSVLKTPPSRIRSGAAPVLSMVRVSDVLALGQAAEHVGLDLVLHPGGRLVRVQRPLEQRRYLLARQDAEQSDQRDDGWGRRAHVEQR